MDYFVCQRSLILFACYRFFAVLLFAFAKGLGALPAFMAAQRLFAASAMALRAAALSLCFRLARACGAASMAE